MVPNGRSGDLATPNYAYEKRQRELAKNKKAEEKRLRKQQRSDDAGRPAPPDGQPADHTAVTPAPGEPSA